MRVVGYVRASTEDQSLTLDAQAAKVRAYAELYDLQLIEVVVDAGASAKSLNRPGLTRVLDMLSLDQIEGVVVAKLDRLTRSVADWQELINNHFGEKKHLLSVQDSIDTRTAAGRLVLNVLLSVAQWEREAIGERTKDALAQKAKNGERVGRAKFGYDLAAAGERKGKTVYRLVENRREQAALRWMRLLKRNGASLQAIADALQERGVKPKWGRRWHKSSVASVLQTSKEE